MSHAIECGADEVLFKPLDAGGVMKALGLVKAGGGG